jgi:hypothetical protein
MGAMEINPVAGGEDGAQSFPLSFSSYILPPEY